MKLHGALMQLFSSHSARYEKVRKVYSEKVMGLKMKLIGRVNVLFSFYSFDSRVLAVCVNDQKKSSPRFRIRAEPMATFRRPTGCLPEGSRFETSGCIQTACLDAGSDGIFQSPTTFVAVQVVLEMGFRTHSSR